MHAERRFIYIPMYASNAIDYDNAYDDDDDDDGDDDNDDDDDDDDDNDDDDVDDDDHELLQNYKVAGLRYMVNRSTNTVINVCLLYTSDAADE